LEKPYVLTRASFIAFNGRSDHIQVEIAIKAGYRHLDLAMVYGNQTEVGAALAKILPNAQGVFPNPDLKVTRKDLFITSKVWNTAHRKELVEKELDETLSQLGLDYLDLYRWFSLACGNSNFLLIANEHCAYSRPLACLLHSRSRRP
jgi:diketogulonate reductase-like aldo/keto reductase